MGAFNLVKEAVSGVVKPVSDAYIAHQQGKVELKKLEIETKKALAVANIEAIREGRVQDTTWEVESIKNSGHKDEWLVGLFSIPLIGAFVPGLSKYVLYGFAILDKMPTWYMVSVGVIVGSTFGVRRVWDFFKR